MRSTVNMLNILVPRHRNRYPSAVRRYIKLKRWSMYGFHELKERCEQIGEELAIIPFIQMFCLKIV